jgi:UDP-N-acetylmuramate dehydrogenase
MPNLLQVLTEKFPQAPFQGQFPLKNLSYFKIGGPAEVYLEIDDREQIISIVKFCKQQNIKLTILGGASNVIIADEGISGLVLKITYDKFTLGEENQDRHLIQVGSGIKTSILVSKTVSAELTGLEYFLGVPGNLGGAVYNNAHYLQKLISDHVSRVEVISADGVSWLDHDQCQFAYDKSRFHSSNEVILTVEFSLKSGNKQQSMDMIKKATEYRANTQPLGIPSSGCIFQNIPVTPQIENKFPEYTGKSFIGGGFIIDQAGLKGTKVGSMEVSEKHAAFFVNHGEGTAQQVKELITIVKDKVKSKFDIDLEEEVFYLGDN